ncbi:hypothetical protein PaG_04349 [Moesziomyces aphidis]|uniref:Uncharacterized protein n=1 Tax=Moesziomyces aphidis TaxID=84754 RepID=W3VIH3_MOEAP|nr:hypothetical protein PaG_04349 [Moesziomyces aphidis]
MSSVHDTDLSDSISIISTIESEDASSDFELVDFDDDPRPQPPSSTHSIAPSVVSDDQSAPPSPALHESRFHFPDPAAIFSEANLDSSSICTIASPAQPEPFSLPPPAQRVQLEAESLEPESIKSESFEPELLEPTTPKVEQLRHGIQATSLQAAPDRVQTSHDPFFGESKRTRASLLHLRRTALASPKTTCLLMLLAAVLLGVPFHSNSLLPGWRTSDIQINATQSQSTAKFVTPAAQAPSSESSLATSQPPHWLAKPLVALPSTSAPASIATVSDKRSRSKRESTALQPPVTTPKALNLAPQAHSGSSAKPSSNGACKVARQRARRRSNPLAPLASRVAYVPVDRPVFPMLSDASSLADATTASWDYWIEQLDSYYHVVLRPSIIEARLQAVHAAQHARRFHEEIVLPALQKHAVGTAHRTADQASKAAKRAHRYHQQHVVPALSNLQKHTVRTAHHTAEWTAQYNRDQLRPALAFMQQQTIETARKSANYQRTVVGPALVQLGAHSIEAAKTTSHGLNKAAKRFSLEAAQTVKHVRHATNINLEALGVDQYVGFLKSTWKDLTHQLAFCPHHKQACEPCDCAGGASSPLGTCPSR